jgi:(2Fe-2S) ferredoxin
MTASTRQIFLCTNKRRAPLVCCARRDSAQIADYLKERLQTSYPPVDSGIHVSTTKCLGRCHEGPVLAVYPEDVWYTYVDERDIEEIISEHLLNGRIVKRLILRARFPGRGGPGASRDPDKVPQCGG